MCFFWAFGNDHVLPGPVIKFLIIVVAKPPHRMIVSTGRRWGDRSRLCVFHWGSLSLVTWDFFGTQVEVTDLIQAFATVLVRWTLVILDGTNATVTFLFNIDKGTHDMLHFHILYLIFPFAVSTPSTKTFQTALFSGQVCNLMELCWEKLINSFLSVKSREELDLSFSEKPVGIGAFVWLWLIHNWFIGLAADRKCFRRLFFLASMSGVSLPWHNVPMSGWQRSGLSWSQRCRPWLSLVYLTWKPFSAGLGDTVSWWFTLGRYVNFVFFAK